MASITLSHALADCLDRLDDGIAPDDCLDGFPHLRPELLPLLDVARELRHQRLPVGPSPFFVVSLRQMLRTGLVDYLNARWSEGDAAPSTK